MKEYLDACFKPMGFVEKPDTLAGQNYQASFDGRAIKVHCSVRRRTRYGSENISYRKYIGHRLEITLDTGLKTRLAIATSVKGLLGSIVASINSRYGSQRLHNLDPTFNHLEVWAADPRWARRFLSDNRILQAMRELFPPNQLPPNIGVKFFPEKLSFSQRTSLSNITPETARKWVSVLIYLANFAESLPPPITSEPTWFEKKSAENPRATAIILALLLLGVPVLIAFAVVVIALIFVILAGA